MSGYFNGDQNALWKLHQSVATPSHLSDSYFKNMTSRKSKLIRGYVTRTNNQCFITVVIVGYDVARGYKDPRIEEEYR